MKKLFLAFFIIGGTLGFQSCKDDKDEKKTVSQITFDGKTTNLAGAAYYADDVNTVGEGLYSHYVQVYADGLKYEDEFMAVMGSGDMIELHLMSNSETGLPTGTFTISDNWGDHALDAELYTGYTMTLDEQGYDDYSSAETGTVTVEKDGSNYIVTFDLTLNEKKLTGSYTGSVTSIVWE